MRKEREIGDNFKGSDANKMMKDLRNDKDLR
jgi:hypothetical protein